jgi:hypothetical protein
MIQIHAFKEKEKEGSEGRPQLMMNLKLSTKVSMKLKTPPSLHGFQFPMLTISLVVRFDSLTTS